MKPVSPSFAARRAIGCVLAGLALFCLANYRFEWGLFGRFGEGVTVTAFAVLVMFAIPFVHDEHDRVSGGNNGPGLRRWPYFLVLSMMMLGFVIFGPVAQLAKGEPIQQGDWIRLGVVELVTLVAGIYGWRRLKKLHTRSTA